LRIEGCGSGVEDRGFKRATLAWRVSAPDTLAWRVSAPDMVALECRDMDYQTLILHVDMLNSTFFLSFFLMLLSFFLMLSF